MKKYFLFILLSSAFPFVQGTAQTTNTFPSTGNTGIGTTSPATLLEIKNAVSGGLGPVLRLTGGGDVGAQCAIDLATFDPGSYSSPARIVATDVGLWGCNLDFQSKPTGNIANALVTRLRITSSGDVGIGTTNPQAKLAVNGDIFGKKVKVTQTGWPDYVFDASYRLRSLAEVEAYIQQHHHLPEIPSAVEIEKNGLDLGENQKTVVAKIEELTLYILQLNKKIESLEKELAQMKSSQ